MGEEKLIQVSVQLPASELGRLSDLMEHVQRLLSMEGGQTASPAADAVEAAMAAASEAAGNAAFDLNRFQALREANAQQAWSEPVAAEAAPLSLEESKPPEALAVPDTRPMPDSIRQRIDGLELAPEATAAGSPISGAPEAGEMVWAGSFQQAPEAFAAGEAVWSETPPPPAAGFPAAALEAAPPAGRMGREEEAQVIVGPAAVTAEAVSLAFRRDDRRYDNGFPLY